MSHFSISLSQVILLQNSNRLLILIFMLLLLTSELFAKPTEIPTTIGFTAAGSISEVTGLAATANIVLDLPYHAVEFDSTTAPIHSWQNFEGPTFEVLVSQKIWQMGLGYRKVLRFFGFLPFGFGLTGGISTIYQQDSQTENDTKDTIVPFLKYDATFLGVTLGIDVVLDPKTTKQNGFFLGFRF